MRTTLTLDPDVAAMLEEHRARSGLSLKQAVNQALRAGLESRLKPTAPRQPYRTTAVNHGKALIANLDDVAGVLECLDESAP